MNMTSVFNYIFIKHAQEPARLLRNGGLIFFAMCALIFLLSGADHQNIPAGLSSIYGIGIIIVAIVVLGRHTFNEFKNPLKSVGWLTLPATTEEKWLANFITSFLLAPVVFLLFLTFGTAFVKLLLLLLGWNPQFEVFNPISYDAWDILTGYWVIHPILFFGAIYFKKSVILKTTASMAILFFLLVLYTAVLGWFLLPDDITNGLMMHDGNFNIEGEHKNGKIEVLPPQWLHSVKTVIFYGSFIYFWGLSYLRLREVDV